MRKAQRVALAAAFANGYRQAAERVREIAPYAPSQAQRESVEKAAVIVAATAPDLRT